MPEGIRTLHSSRAVDQVLTDLQALLREKNIKLFAVIDHSGEAAAVGLKMPNTKLVLFGNPAAGTPLMITASSLALDLPLKLLLSQEPDGSTAISWNDPAWLRERHGFPGSMLPKLAAVELLAKALAQSDTDSGH
jgi:uncharacterized protein (DUF302 family)